MPRLRNYTYPSILTLEETSYILNVLKRNMLHTDIDVTNVCCHFKDDNFLHEHDIILGSFDHIPKENSVLLQSLFRNIRDVAKGNPESESVVSKFFKTIRSMSYSNVLILCAQYLTEYHGISECSEYLSLTLKLYLKVFQIKSLHYTLHKFPDDKMKNMISYLKFIHENKCRSEVFRGYLDFFLYSFLKGPLERNVITLGLPNVFEIAHKFRFNIFVEIFQDRKFKKYIKLLILLNLEAFLMLVTYGHEDKCHEGSLEDYEIAIFKSENSNNIFIANICQSDEVFYYRYRSLQVLYLYVESIYHNENRARICERTLRVVWNTTPDAFLIENQFLSCFCPLNLNAPNVFVHLYDAWKWYERSVLNEVGVREKSPRTLKHLSRCTIRRRLTACVQMPFGVPTLDIPETIKHYLCLNY